MISFVYFDLGGVVELDFSGTNKWDELKKELGITADEDKKFADFWSKHEPELCIGRDTDTLIPVIEKEFGVRIPKGYSLLINGFVNRFQVNKSIWPVIEEIHRSCQVGLLTNMYPHMFAAIKGRGLLPNITWDVIIDSSVEGIQKPDLKIFQLAQERAGVKGKEILFAENTTTHVKAAQDFGWQVFRYDPTKPKNSSQELLKLFRSLK